MLSAAGFMIWLGHYSLEAINEIVYMNRRTYWGNRRTEPSRNASSFKQIAIHMRWKNRSPTLDWWRDEKYEKSKSNPAQQKILEATKVLVVKLCNTACCSWLRTMDVERCAPPATAYWIRDPTTQHLDFQCLWTHYPSLSAFVRNIHRCRKV